MRVEKLVKGRTQRSYLKRDGWWAQLILDQFEFLRDLGYDFSGPMGGVQFHQNGNYVWYQGPNSRYVVFEYDPEADGSVSAMVGTPGGPRSLDVLLDLVPRIATDRPSIQRRVRAWSEGLKRLAPELLT